MDEEKILQLESMCRFRHEIKEGFCTSISFHDEDHFGSTIRRNPRKHEIVGLVASFSKLKNLNIRKSRLGRLPVFKSRELEHVDVSCNDLEEFPEWLSGLSLKSLNLGANRIRHIPDISSMPLETLKLHKNVHLSKLPKIGGGIKSLNLFLLPSMGRVPEEVMNLSSLEVFSFGGTTSEKFPDLSGLPRLKWLTLAVNRFERLDESICRLESLEGLCLAKNMIRSVPSDIGNLKNLKSLTLYYNRIASLPDSFFGLSLQKLNLSRNPLTEKDRKMAEGFGKHMEFFRI